jgi:hypothetical protein
VRASGRRAVRSRGQFHLPWIVVARRWRRAGGARCQRRKQRGPIAGCERGRRRGRCCARERGHLRRHQLPDDSPRWIDEDRRPAVGPAGRARGSPAAATAGYTVASDVGARARRRCIQSTQVVNVAEVLHPRITKSSVKSRGAVTKRSLPLGTRYALRSPRRTSLWRLRFPARLKATESALRHLRSLSLVRKTAPRFRRGR